MKSTVILGVSVLLLLALPALADWDLDGYEWSVVFGDDSLNVSMDRHSRHRVDQLRRLYDEPFVWVRRGRSEWVITDPSIVRELRDVMETPAELDEVQRRMELESKVLEESMREFEERVSEMEREIDERSFEAALEIAEAAKELKTEELEAAAERMEEGARELERWADELEKRLVDEALPLIEDAIRDGRAKRLR